MNKALEIISSAVVVCLFVFLFSCNEDTKSEANTNGSASVQFGNPDSDATQIPCSGKGICMLTTDTGGISGIGSVEVDFELSTPEHGDNMLTFSFDINYLLSVDSSAALEFVTITEDGELHAHPQYNFGADYHMHDRKLCDELNINELTIFAGAHNDNTLDNASGKITVICHNVTVMPKHHK